MSGYSSTKGFLQVIKNWNWIACLSFEKHMFPNIWLFIPSFEHDSSAVSVYQQCATIYDANKPLCELMGLKRALRWKAK